MAFLTRIYNWVTDRNNGVPITASRMDAEFDNIVTGVNNLNSLVILGEWIAEADGAVAYGSATTFTIAGVNVTSRYHAGRRVKIVNNGGASTSYGTVLSSAFVTNTTVTVATDDAAAILSTVTAVSYGLQSYTNPAYLSPRTALRAVANNIQAYTQPLAAFVTMSAEAFDSRNEYSPSTFTAREGGYYFVSANIAVIAAAGGDATVIIMVAAAGAGSVYRTLATSALFQSISISGLFLLTKGQTIQIKFSCTADVVIQADDTMMSILRLA